MPDLTQIFLTIVIIILTVLLTVIGIQVYRILKDFHKTVNKMNKILDDSSVVSEIAAKEATSFSDFMNGITSLFSFLGALKKRHKNE